jgi:Protein of unknown function (DUF1552)
VRIRRRQLLQALGLGGLASLFHRNSVARADGLSSPSRIVFYVQPHGHIPDAWNMGIPGGPTDQFAERSLLDLQASDFSPTLLPLYGFRDRLLAIEGLSHTSALADIAAVAKAGTGDLNNHQIGVADVLTGSRALQREGTYCTGGSRSLDQELAARGSAPGRFDSRVYGFDYVPNSVVSPFSYLGPGQATPMVSDPGAAFSDLLGYVRPVAAPTTRADAIASLRPSVLDFVGREYDLLAPQLGSGGRQKIEAHRALVRELELSLGTVGAVGAAPRCDTTFASAPATGVNVGPSVRQFMSLIRLAFACDLTRIVTFSAPVPQCPELGYPADATFHGYAHQSILGNTSCGQMFSPLAAQAMTDLDAWHAGHVAYLLQQLDSVPEGSGTLLDHTVVVWVTELATPTHQHWDVCTLLAGGCNGFFETGRYVRYPRTLPNPLPTMALTGPAHNRLHVSLLQAMGQTDTSFGMTTAVADDGTTLSLTGPLAEL